MHPLTDGPYLTQVPDGRRAPLPLLPSVAFVYLALMVGIVPVALVAGVQALLLRRLGAASVSAVVGMVGFVSPFPVLILATQRSGLDHVALAMLVVRLLSVGLGFLLFRVLEPHVRGHQLLSGSVVDLSYVIVPAFAWVFLAPGWLRMAAELPAVSWFGLGAG